MHLTELLHKTFEEELPQVHKIRLNSLMAACEATRSNTLYLTGLGRASSIRIKNRVIFKKLTGYWEMEHFKQNAIYFTSDDIKDYSKQYASMDSY